MDLRQTPVGELARGNAYRLGIIGLLLLVVVSAGIGIQLTTTLSRDRSDAAAAVATYEDLKAEEPSNPTLQQAATISPLDVQVASADGSANRATQKIADDAIARKIALWITALALIAAVAWTWLGWSIRHRVKCPSCRKPIRIEASRCPYCRAEQDLFAVNSLRTDALDSAV